MTSRLLLVSLLSSGIALLAAPAGAAAAELPFPAPSMAVHSDTAATPQSPVGGPALDLFLTGTTDLSSDVCGTATSFAVPPGTDIRFCYFAGNAGSVTFTRHDLADSAGPIFANFPFTLAPQMGMYLMRNRQPVSTGTNVAQWSAYNPGPTDLVTATDGTPISITAPVVACNGPTSTFSNGLPVGWTSADLLAMATTFDPGVDWQSLGQCGEVANYTGGGGGAACASSDLAGSQAYDTQLRTHSFGLAGQTSARIEFLINFQNFSAGDALYLDASVDFGENWTNLAQATENSFGAFRALPGAAIAVDLAPLLGNPNVRLGWRYVNHADNASDYYIQIDNVRLACGNGLFSDGFESGNTHAWSATSL